MSDLDAIKRAAEQRADADCEVGLANLEARIALVDEYAVSGDATGKRLLVPERALMTGMAEHLRTAMRYRLARRVMLSAVVAVALLVPAPATAQQGLHEGGGGRAPLLVPNTQVSNTLRALDRLHRMGYRWTSAVGADKAIRSWEQSNGLVVDGLVGPQVLGSLNLTAAASVPAVRVDPPVSAPAPPVGDVEQIIRDVWPDELENEALRIATRESRLQPGVINRNGNATGLFQIMWTVHRGWLCPQLGVCAQSDLQDARTNAEAALALYQRDGGWGPWRLG